MYRPQPRDDDFILWLEREDAAYRNVARIRFNIHEQTERITNRRQWRADCSACRQWWIVDNHSDLGQTLPRHRDEHHSQWMHADEADLPDDYWDGTPRHRDILGRPLSDGHHVWQVSTDGGLPAATMLREWVIVRTHRRSVSVLPAWRDADRWTETRRADPAALSRTPPTTTHDLPVTTQLGLFGS